MSLFARTWQRRSRLFQVFVVVVGGLILCVTAARLAHPLSADVRALLGGGLLCAGGLLAAEPSLDLLLSHYQTVGLVVAAVGIAFGIYFAVDFIHAELLRFLCAAAGAAIPAGLLGRKEWAEDEPVKDETKRRLTLFGCFLLFLGTFVAFYPS
jgi:hypothetical protein